MAIAYFSNEFIYHHKRLERHREETASGYGTGARGSYHNHQNSVSDFFIDLVR